MLMQFVCWVLVMAVAAGLYSSGVLWYRLMDAENEARLARRDYEHAEVSMATMLAEIDHLVDQLAENRIKAEERLRRHEHRADQRINDLLGQVQSLSERLASLKLATAGERVEDGTPGWAPTEKATIPYSEGLWSFLSALETEEARQLVEDYIEAQRSVGRDDEQILDQLNRGEYVNV